MQWSTGVDVISNPLTVNAIPTLTLIFHVSSPSHTKQAPVNSQSLNRYSYVTNNPLRYTDPIGQWTVMTALEVDFGFLGGGTESLGFIWDSEGNWAILTSACVTVGTMGITVSGGIQVTNADNIWQVLNGQQVKFTVGGNYGIGLSGGYVTDTDLSLYQGGQVNFGLGFKGSTSFSGTINSHIILSSDMIGDVGSTDLLLFSMYTTGQISVDLYASFYYYYHSGGDPMLLLCYIMMQLYSNADKGDNE